MRSRAMCSATDHAVFDRHRHLSVRDGRRFWLSNTWCATSSAASCASNSSSACSAASPPRCSTSCSSGGWTVQAGALPDAVPDRHAGRPGNSRSSCASSSATGLRDLVSQVLTFDYLGALAVSILFPVLLVPHLGLVRSGLLFGLLNVAVALWALWLFRAAAGDRLAGGQGIAAFAVVLLGRLRRGRGLTSIAEGDTSTPTVVPRRVLALPAHRRHPLEGRPAPAPQQQPAVQLARRIPLPRGARASRAGDAARRSGCWCLGGGDGLAVREILKYPQVRSR